MRIAQRLTAAAAAAARGAATAAGGPASAAAAGGMCGAPWLREPRDLPAAARTAVDVCNALVQLVERSSGGGAARAADDAAAAAAAGLACLQQLDSISDTLCKVLDAAEFMRQAHAHDEWRGAAEETYRGLASYMHALNGHRPLHAALVAVTSDARVMARLTEEQRRMAVLLQQEFEREGIHLPDAERSRLVALNDAVHEAAAAFQGGAQACAGSFSVADAAPGLARAAREALHGSATAAAAAPEPHALLEAALTGAACPALRQALLCAREAECAPNVPALHALRDARHTLASAIGYPSFAHMALSDRMAGSPEHAGAFLTRTRAAIAPRVAAELARLSDAKRAIFGAAAAAAPGVALGPEAAARVRAALRADGALARPLPARSAARGALGDNLRALAATPVYAWDVPLLQRVVHRAATQEALGARLQQQGQQPAPDSAAWSELHESPLTAQYMRYATVGGLLRGLGSIVRACFGVAMVREELSVDEAWDVAAAAAPPQQLLGGTAAGGLLRALVGGGGGGGGSARGTALLKYRLLHEAEGDLGTIYFDLFARPGKGHGGAAHYVIRCGKAVHEWDGGLERALGCAPSGGGGGGPAQQLPVVALVTSIAAPPTGGGGGGGGARSWSALEGVRLTPREVETLHHEFGHALHSLLSRTQFQHLHGTRAALDFVEVPSHVFEYFARDYRVVRGWAVDPATGQPMPRELFDAVEAGRARFRALELQGSLAYAALDLGLYGPLRPLGLCARAVEADAARAPCGPTVWHEQQLQATAGREEGALDGDDAAAALEVPLTRADAGALGRRPLALRRPGDGGGTDPARADPDGGVWRGDSGALLRAAQTRFSLLPPVAGSAAHGGFVHLVTYASGYYSYLYAAAFSAAVWRRLFVGDPLRREAGDAYRAGFLAPGAGADPVALLAGACGGPPGLGALVDELRDDAPHGAAPR